MSWPSRHPTPPATTSYTVTARREQAERWEAAAGEVSLPVCVWLGETADTYLRELVRVGRAAPLTWLRDRFRVLVTDTTARPEVAREVEVAGMVSGPFGIFRGNGQGLASSAASATPWSIAPHGESSPRSPVGTARRSQRNWWRSGLTGGRPIRRRCSGKLRTG